MVEIYLTFFFFQHSILAEQLAAGISRLKVVVSILKLLSLSISGRMQSSISKLTERKIYAAQRFVFIKSHPSMILIVVGLIVS